MEKATIWEWTGQATGRAVEVAGRPFVVSNIYEAFQLLYIDLVYIVEGRVVEK